MNFLLSLVLVLIALFLVLSGTTFCYSIDDDKVILSAYLFSSHLGDKTIFKKNISNFKIIESKNWFYLYICSRIKFQLPLFGPIDHYQFIMINHSQTWILIEFQEEIFNWLKSRQVGKSDSR